MFRINGNEIYLTRGDTAQFSVSITDDKNEEYQLQENDKLIFTVRKKPKNTEILIQKRGADIIIAPSDTSGLPFGEYSYDVELTYDGGIVDTIIPPSPFVIGEENTW